MKKLPIFGKTGSEVKEWVFVDDDDYKDTMSHRWVRDKSQRVFRYIDPIKKGPKKYLGHQILGKTPQSMYDIIHIDGDINNYCRDNLMAEKREE